jgi:predicted DCC family thiol-disulfide oxidoreductase YuxK
MSQKLTIYFDGLCRLCSLEINHYKKQKGAEQMDFVDITAPTFDAKKQGVDPFLVHKIMHVKRGAKIYTKVDAFVEIWKELPKYNWAVGLANNKLVRPFLNIGYEAFALVRPYLPRKKENCEDSPYCETHNKGAL